MDHRDTILDAALPHIVFEGWTEGVLARAASESGLNSFVAKRTFAKPIDAIDYSSQRADTLMVQALRRDYSLSTMKIRERIATAVMVRFRQQASHREAVRRALGVYALPWNAPRALAALYATVDAIWREAGDTSTDYNFYTKRLLLSQVYTTTLRVWLDDHSPDLADTEVFLRRRIEDVMTIEKLKAQARDRFGKIENWLPRRWA